MAAPYFAAFDGELHCSESNQKKSLVYIEPSQVNGVSDEFA
jgi:hypothetical protein